MVNDEWPDFRKMLQKVRERVFKFKSGAKELECGTTFVIDVPKGCLEYNKLICFVAPTKKDLELL